ncbi:MAG TPA: Ig domain-containing protein [Acidimicrobiales bacterium]|nr:Ig domain-containing protein [Acidimicrobiales bacterium]
MSESSMVRRAVAGAVMVAALGLGAVTAVQPAHAASGPVAAGTAGMSPSPAPLPTLLPNGNAPQSATLYSSACSSASFCVAVGTVEDAELDSYPLVETYDGSTWSASTAPLPANADAGPSNGAVLYSVSCGSDGTCGAAGDYNDFDGTVQYQNGLLEALSGGTWTATEATLASGPDSGLVNLRGVSCPDATTCVAIGDVYVFGSKTVPSTWSTLIYLLASGTWQLQTAIPVPSSYQNSLELSSVSCADESDCVVVGSYEDASSSQGLILTLTSGSWSAEEASLPSNANTEPNARGMKVLDSVDCVDAADCVAGGAYVDSSGNIDPLLEILQSGTWTPQEGPVPPDSQSNTLAAITGVSCPAVGTCLADGYYWTDYQAGDESGMVLTQSGPNWSAASAPLPVTASAKESGNQTSTTIAGLDGISCSTTGTCMAVGGFGPSASDQQGLIVSLPAGRPIPLAITSAGQATFTDHRKSSFTVTATGYPTPLITEKGKLPKGLHFKKGKGSATISGTPAVKKPGSYPVTITASNGPTSSVDQTVSVVVGS